MKTSMSFVALCFAAFITTGCGGTQGQFQQSTGTGVNLKANNYKMVKAGATGESMGFYLFGVIPVVNPSFAEAKTQLYKSVNQSLEGRAIALAKQTEDRTNLYLILFSLPKNTITADLVEFTDKANKGD